MTSFSEYKRRVDAGEPGLDVDASVPKDARPYQGHRAGFISRALSAFIDIGSVIALIFLINLVIALVRLIIERVQGATLPQFGWSVAGGFLLIWHAHHGPAHHQLLRPSRAAAGSCAALDLLHRLPDRADLGDLQSGQ